MGTHATDAVSRLTLSEAAEHLNSAGLPNDVALRDFLLAHAAHKDGRSLPVFEVKYPYGAPIVGHRSVADKFSKILPPCWSGFSCQACKEFLQVFHAHRPLAVVLSGSCEEYLEYEQAFEKRLRRASLRFYSTGDVIGVSKLLSRFYYPDKAARLIFDKAARRISSGARSVFFSTRVSNPTLTRSLLQQMPEKVSKLWLDKSIRELPPTQVGKMLDRDHWLFLRLIANAAAAQRPETAWHCRLLLIPAEPLVELLKKTETSKETKDFLHALLAEEFFTSQNTRADYLRQMVVFDRLSGQKRTMYADTTVRHLIEVIRGEFPGFQPHDPRLGDDFGPYTDVRQYLYDAGLTTPTLMEAFPWLIRPVHFDPRKHTFVYYSFERPTLPDPVGKIQSVRSLTGQVDAGLRLLADSRPDLFDSRRWGFFVSGGKPSGPPPTRKSALQRMQMDAAPYQKSVQIEKDFEPQIQNAKKRGWLSSGDRIFHENKWGFMASFIRIYTTADA